MFSLVVDDFGVRYTKQADADHLIQTLEANAYKLKVRPLGDKYLGMSIAFDRHRKTVSLSMPGYITKMLQRFRPQYLFPGYRPAKTPGRYIAPSYTTAPHVVFIDKTEKLSPTLITELQAIIGTLLYYARAVDPTLCSTTPATWFSTHLPTPPIYVDHTPDPSRELYSSSATKTIPPGSMDPYTFSPQ